MRSKETTPITSREIAVKRPTLPLVVKPRSTVAPKRGAARKEALTGSRTELIQRKAYSIYEARKGKGGTELDDWLQAEAEIDKTLRA